MRPLVHLIVLTALITACSKKIHPPYDTTKIPKAPDYSLLSCWAAHPEKEDEADKLPGKSQFSIDNPLPAIDVFFVHPTIYTKKHNANWPWQGDVYDTQLNEKVDQSTIRYQASVFNKSAYVYAPRYRQAHLAVFTTGNDQVKDQALQFAYEDVKGAFEHYLKNYNQGKPFIIASHSQGTIHAARLIKDYIENKPLADQLVAAYLVGIALKTDLFESLKPCTSPTETGCWVSWNTYERNYYPQNHKEIFAPALSTNPLTWSVDTVYAQTNLNQASVLRNFNKVYSNLCDAQNHQGLLWITKPKFFGSAFYRSKRYHIADYNLFYGNIRENVSDRIDTYIKLKNP
ncbi:MAG: DUF3089 domain-containing protein [Cyclobacteriaceae bacterium]|nr:DUF3089 domain-containing protein [Cyclobacteriaceae bacterium]